MSSWLRYIPSNREYIYLQVRSEEKRNTWSFWAIHSLVWGEIYVICRDVSKLSIEITFSSSSTNWWAVVYENKQFSHAELCINTSFVNCFLHWISDYFMRCIMHMSFISVVDARQYYDFVSCIKRIFRTSLIIFIS